MCRRVSQTVCTHCPASTKECPALTHVECRRLPLPLLFSRYFFRRQAQVARGDRFSGKPGCGGRGACGTGDPPTHVVRGQASVGPVQPAAGAFQQKAPKNFSEWTTTRSCSAASPAPFPPTSFSARRRCWRGIRATSIHVALGEILSRRTFSVLGAEGGQPSLGRRSAPSHIN